MNLKVIFCLLYCFTGGIGANYLIKTINSSTGLALRISKDGNVIWEQQLGVGFNLTQNSCGLDCYDFDVAQVHILQKQLEDRLIIDIDWNLQPTSKVLLQDCTEFLNYEWFGGPEHAYQIWPINGLDLNDFVLITGSSAVFEPYWLSSSGGYIYVQLPTDGNVIINQKAGKGVCFKSTTPLKYTLSMNHDPKVGHQHALATFLNTPKGISNVNMIQSPIWSTWVQYKRDINEQKVLDYSQQIINHGFNGQLEIDDNWERCYGSLEFDQNKFPDPKSLVERLKKQGFRVTLWVHPFINTNCKDVYNEALNQDYFVKNTDGNVLTKWWNSGTNGASLIDFRKPDAAEWWSNRLWKLRNETGLDGFKFDAGESSWAPTNITEPNIMTKRYVETCAQFGDSIEVRSGFHTQYLPNFVRMLDKDTRWSVNNGLQSLTPTLLQMNMVGYPFVLPDMVGGNAYGADHLTPELFIRWLEANVFMPSIQFSITPWTWNDTNVVEITKKMVDLHKKYSDIIIQCAKRSVNEYIPMNPPIWWVDPTNSETFKINDQYLLCDNILVAPVLESGSIKRDVYLPNGVWIDGNTEEVIQGPIRITYNASIDVLPFYIKRKCGSSKNNKQQIV